MQFKIKQAPELNQQTIFTRKSENPCIEMCFWFTKRGLFLLKYACIPLRISRVYINFNGKCENSELFMCRSPPDHKGALHSLCLIRNKYIFYLEVELLGEFLYVEDLTDDR